MFSANTDGFRVLEDCALVAENLMLAACAAGLGTSWVGLAQNFLNSLEVKRLLGVPTDWITVAPIIVGHPKTNIPAVIQKKPELLFIN
jgi:nitroreductase